MKKITAEECRSVVERGSILEVFHHHCGVCGAATKYVFARAREALDEYDDPEELLIGYDSSCGCCSKPHPPTLISWQELADDFNRQNPEARKSMWGRFQVGSALFV